MTHHAHDSKRRGRLSLPLLLAHLCFLGILFGSVFGSGTLATAATDAETAALDAPYLIVEREDGTIVFQISLGTVDAWIVRWNHSVTGIEVSDHYAFEKGSMVLTSSHTPAFDAGLGHIPGRGTLESDGEGGYWIRDIDELVPGNAYALRVGAESVDHRIVHAGITYSLSQEAAGERVVIRVAQP